MAYSSEELTQMVFGQTMKNLRTALVSESYTIIDEQVDGQEGFLCHLLFGRGSYFLTVRFNEEHDAGLIQLYMPAPLPQSTRKNVASYLKKESAKCTWGRLGISSRGFVHTWVRLDLKSYRCAVEELLRRDPDALDILSSFCAPGVDLLGRILRGLPLLLLPREEFVMPTLWLMVGISDKEKSRRQDEAMRGENVPLPDALNDINAQLKAVCKEGSVTCPEVSAVPAARKAKPRRAAKTAGYPAPDAVSEALALFLTERDEQGEDAATEE